MQRAAAPGGSGESIAANDGLSVPPLPEDEEPGRVLAVDDSAISLEILCQLLEQDGHELLRATSAASALEMVAQLHPDVIVCDLHMPDMDGFVMLERLRSGQVELPVVYVSVDDRLESVLQAIHSRAFGYVLKKGNGVRLLRPTVRQALAHVRAVRRNVGLSRELRRANEALEQRVAERTLQLEQTIQELEHQKQELASMVQRLEESRKLALMQERLATLGVLAASVAHDINNPASYVLSNVHAAQHALERIRIAIAGAPPSPQLAAALDAAAEAAQVLDDSLEGAGRIITIARNITPFACPPQAAATAADVNEAIRIACRTVENEIRHRAQLEMQLGNLPLTTGDQKRLVQAFVNLLSNAALAIPEGNSPENHISVTSQANDGRIEVTVSDTGCGIPKELVARVQEPFFTTRAPGQGTGLGLALVAQIAAEHGGDLELSSHEQEGTTVTLSFPIEARTTVSPPRSTSRPGDAELSGLRVLIIDDDARLLRALRRELGLRNDVTTAHGGQEALQILARDTSFDLILCDLMMPDLDGPRLHDLLAQQTAQVLPRLAFMTGGAFTDRARDFVTSVTCPVLPKPVTQAALREAYLRMRRRHSAPPVVAARKAAAVGKGEPGATIPMGRTAESGLPDSAARQK